ncbi:hypothetical protein J7E97_08185 [Streptomyces sp. ISL-66]|uniref:hypothetical protein n=1 Tax=Streptomyces sp. ISL-66 TaxID=2819186 RepID=UPI001BE544AB|nr:hypothetical protein [Streptomyces sp. ISL-66]MBT2467852.1 hypothetical protein [Streptomyces sp. ISL-66]
MTGRVNCHVYVTSKDGTKQAWLAPGDALPGWATIDSNLLEGESTETEPPAPQGGEPPRSGKGSGLAAWQEYAASLGVAYDAEMSRDDVITAVDAAASTSEG